MLIAVDFCKGFVGIKELLSAGEGDTVEFKASLSEREEILKTICGFSNSGGGTILVGVGDHGELLGVTLGRGTLEQFASSVKSSFDPPIVPQIEVVGVGSKKVLVIRVLEGLNKPYFYNGVAYKRVGKSTQRIPREEVERMIVEKHRGLLLFEETVYDAQLDVFDELRVKSFADMAWNVRRLQVRFSGVGDLLGRLGLLKGSKPTAAAILLFAKNTQAFLPYAVTKCGRFRDGALVDEKEFGGTIFEQLEASMGFLQNNLRVTHTVDRSGRRVEEWEVPLEALREVLVNAYAHRDYSIPSPIYVKVFDDRIEVTNPGGLIAPLTPQKLKQEHPSIQRNPKIANALFVAGYVERWGYGTNRVVELCIRRGLREPEFLEEDGFFKAIVFRQTANENERRVLELLAGGADTTAEVAEKLGVDERTARKYLSSLVFKGLVVRKRVGRTIKYAIKP